jgi:MtN3 and saliva related transmembrane protein
MNNMIEVVGYLAAFLTTASFVPQVIKTIKTRDTSGISLLMYSMFVVGVLMWLIYGILIEVQAIIIANVVTFCLSAIVLAIKVKNTVKR